MLNKKIKTHECCQNTTVVDVDIDVSYKNIQKNTNVQFV